MSRESCTTARRALTVVVVVLSMAGWRDAQALWAQATQPAQSDAGDPAKRSENAAKKPERHITPQQAKELFRSVDDILRFASADSKLPIRHAVKRRLTTRDAVESYLNDKMKEDKDTKRMERSEIVLKKFGLLDRAFDLRPFLVSLLREQIAGYYDSKTKTVNLLDWIEPETQKPVLAHELTHALQDQHLDLEKWESQSEDDLSRNVKDDNEHLAKDETDSAREAAVEGQAMAVYIDYGLKPMGKTIADAPDMVATMKDMADSEDSPVLSKAPLLLKEALLFPYREGLGFEQALLKDLGPEKAFAGVLDRPPATSYEIMNPQVYERVAKAPLLRMPDVHELLDANWEPYDIGVMGQLDVRIVSELFGGEKAAAVLTPEWDGGIYYAVQNKKLKAAGQGGSTSSVGLFYLSRWKSEAAAKTFASIYADQFAKKYSSVTPDANAEAAEGERVYTTSEGPALVLVSGKQVFTSESFDLATARKLGFMAMGAQQGSETQVEAGLHVPGEDLTGALRRMLSSCGMLKAMLVR